MCGILGYVARGGTVPPAVQARLPRALHRLRRRGPDAQGTCQGDGWLFGHRRLAVLDPTPAGAQPLQDPATGLTLTYNGEIYNFLDLRAELEAHGHRFTSKCDTEVLLRAWLEWGEGCLDRLWGCFAFAVVDPRRRELFLARDRLGVKPLFYAERPGALVFGSAIPPIQELGGFSWELCLPALSHYLTTGKFLLEDQTPVAGVASLPPGCCRRWRLDGSPARERRYWQLPVLPAAAKKGLDFPDAVARTRELTEDAVRRRLISDVPVGAFLSGGLDSAIVAAVIAADRPLPPLYCAGTDDQSCNEFDYADLVAAHLGTTVDHVRVDADDFARDWQFLVREKGLPLATPNEVSIYRLARTLRERCTVTLTGEGADEIFGGYILPQFGARDFARAARDPADVNPDDPAALALAMAYGRAFFINETDFYLATCSWLGLPRKQDVLRPDVWEALEWDGELCAHYEDVFAAVEDCTPFDRFMHLHCRYNLESLLMRVDSSTMAAGVEARVPFTDHRLAELAFACPDDYRIAFRDPATAAGAYLAVPELQRRDLLETKRLTRHAFAADLPEAVIARPKMSFPVPFAAWFRGPLADWLRESCAGSTLATELFRPGAVAAMFDTRDTALWPVVNACLWWDLVREPAPVGV